MSVPGREINLCCKWGWNSTPCDLQSSALTNRPDATPNTVSFNQQLLIKQLVCNTYGRDWAYCIAGIIRGGLIFAVFTVDKHLGKLIQWIITWQVMLLCTTQWAHPYRKYFTVHDWPPFPLWLYCHSVVIHLVSTLTYTLVLLRQLPPISLCKRVSISRVAIVKGLGPCVKYKGHPLQKVIFFCGTCQCVKIKPANNYCNTTTMAYVKIKLHK